MKRAPSGLNPRAPRFATLEKPSGARIKGTSPISAGDGSVDPPAQARSSVDRAEAIAAKLQRSCQEQGGNPDSEIGRLAATMVASAALRREGLANHHIRMSARIDPPRRLQNPFRFVAEGGRRRS